MRSLSSFLLILTLSGGCVLEDTPVGPVIDGGTDSGPDGSNICNPACTESTPVCTADFTCAECEGTNDAYCESQSKVCKTDGTDCVDCNTSAECNDPNAAGCNTGANECEGCEGDTDCDGITGLPYCEAEVCEQCRPVTEAKDCNGTSCNPKTFTCTTTPLGSVETCEECVADSECGEEGNRCVPMDYDGTRYPNADTGFCLKSIELGGSCANPYRIVLTKTSLSGAAIDEYCGINEDLATCPAVRALIADQPCNPGNGDQDCPQPSGLCRELPGELDRCTYLCASVVECVTPGATCGSSGSGGQDYCGG